MTVTPSKIKLIGLDFRLMHPILIVGSAFLLYSALTMDDDGEILRGGYSMFILHRYLGLLWGFLILLYAVYAIFKKKHVHILQPITRPFKEQILEGFSVTAKYFFGRRISDRVRSGMNRHNVMASYAFVGLVFGLFLLAAGGIGMMSSTSDSGFYEIYLAVHVAGAGILLLFVLAHIFAVFNRSNWPLLKAVFTTGKVKESWAMLSMPGYFYDEARFKEETDGEPVMVFDRTM